MQPGEGATGVNQPQSGVQMTPEHAQKCEQAAGGNGAMSFTQPETNAPDPMGKPHAGPSNTTPPNPSAMDALFDGSAPQQQQPQQQHRDWSPPSNSVPPQTNGDITVADDVSSSAEFQKRFQEITDQSQNQNPQDGSAPETPSI